jgi:Zn-dependent peptidase ImmA (M78 family)
MMRRRRFSADQLLRYLGVMTPPVNVHWVATSVGVIILPFEPTSHLSGELTVTDRHATIFVSATTGQLHQRFTISHEMGHLFRHGGQKAFRDTTFAGTKEEIEANRFAADLLMPMWMVDVAAGQFGTDPTQLASVFQVSTAAMRIRLQKWVGL